MTEVRKRVKKSVSELVPPPAKRNAQLEAMAKVASKMELCKPASQELLKVTAVPSGFIQFDRGSRVGGVPLQRYTVLHGESAHGKTQCLIGFESSFLKHGHFVLHIDAELTTPITWLDKLMGANAQHPGFMALRSCVYEEISDAVREFCENIGEAREKGVIAPEVGAIIGLDSWGALVPGKIYQKLRKEGAEARGVDGVGGRLAQVQAAHHAQWLKEIIPLLYQTNCSLVAIARESEDPDATAMDKTYGNDFKIRGGKDVIYASSLSIRIIRSKYLYQGSEESKNLIGERHLMRIWRSKVAGRDEKSTDVFFHTSNGNFIPEGFDHARDVLELAQDMQIVTGESWLTWKGEKLGQGVNRAVKLLTDKPEMLAELEAQVRQGIVIEGAPPEPE